MTEFELPSNPIIRGLVGAVIFGVINTLILLGMTWVERKLMARLQVRYGPNQAGKFGMLQPVADSIKMLLKEDIINTKADRALFTAAPIIALAISFLPFAAIPFTEKLVVSNLSIGILYIVAVASMATIAVIMAGWAPNNKYNLLGGMRSAAQMISYEIPLGLAIIGVVAVVGSLNMVTIVKAQSGLLFGFLPSWFIFLQPIGFVVFFTVAFASASRVPFDLAEAESELVSGYNTEFSGMKFGLLLLAEYIHMALASMLTVLLFLGGWNGPMLPFIPQVIQQLFYFTAKTFALMFVFMWVRSTLPRVRIDQLLNLGWKVLIPLALFNIALTGFGMLVLR